MNKTLLIALTVCASALLPAQTTTSPVIKVTLLGTGVPLLDPAAYLATGRVTAGLMIQAGTERMLFDCGQGILTRLLQTGGGALNPNVSLDKVFISHLHSDHIADLAALYAYGWLYRYDVPLRVWGPGPGPNQPVGTAAMMQLNRLAYDTDFYVRSALFTLLAFPISGVTVDNNVIELWEGTVYSFNGVNVSAFLVNHDPVKPAYGFRVDYQGKSVVFSGDTTYSANLVQHSQNADVLIHEIWGYQVSDGPELYAYHCPPESCASKVFSQTSPKLAVFTHMGIPPGTTANDLIARTKAAGYTGPLVSGADLMEIDVNATGAPVVVAPAANATEVPVNLPAEMRALPALRERMRKSVPHKD